jgi:hypothetical protein
MRTTTDHPTGTRRHFGGAGRLAALAALAAVLTACPPAPTPPGPVLPCTEVASVEVETPIAVTGVQPPGLPPDVPLTFPYPEALAEATSDDGVVHAWVVGERHNIGLGSFAVVQLHVFARDTTTDDPPDEVYRAYPLDHLFTGGLYQSHTGFPVTVNIDAIDPSGGGALISVTYGQRHDVLTTGGYVWEPFRSFTHEIAC